MTQIATSFTLKPSLNSYSSIQNEEDDPEKLNKEAYCTSFAAFVTCFVDCFVKMLENDDLLCIKIGTGLHILLQAAVFLPHPVVLL